MQRRILSQGEAAEHTKLFTGSTIMCIDKQSTTAPQRRRRVYRAPDDQVVICTGIESKGGAVAGRNAGQLAGGGWGRIRCISANRCTVMQL